MKIENNAIYNLNCIEGMQHIRPKSVDLIVTDPPFGIDFKAKKANYNRTQSLVVDEYHEVSNKDYPKFTYYWLKGAKRVLKDSGSMYVFSGYNNLRHILNSIAAHKLHHQGLVWKYNFGLYTQRKWVTAHYHILHIWKDDKQKQFFPDWRYTKKDRFQDGRSKQYADLESVWNISKEYWTGDEKTPNKLPAAVIMKCIGYSSKRGQLVFDPFLGSGQVALVARDMDRRFLGFEIKQKLFDFAIKRFVTLPVITSSARRKRN